MYMYVCVLYYSLCLSTAVFFVFIHYTIFCMCAKIYIVIIYFQNHYDVSTLRL